MKRRVKRILPLILAMFLVTMLMEAQVTIGTKNTPIGGALLMLEDGTVDNSNPTVNSKKGLGLPRVELHKLDPLDGSELSASIGSAGNWDIDEHVGLVVYNIGVSAKDVCAVMPPAGIYVWTGMKWEGIGILKQNKGSSTDEYVGANSYIVKPGETISIPVERAFKIWNDYLNTAANASTKNGKVLDPAYLSRFNSTLKTQIYWQEGEDSGITTGIIAGTPNVTGTGETATITLTAGNNRGNALLQLQNDANEVLWQWHIWVIDEDPSENLWEYASSGETGPSFCSRFMNRNLGAIVKGSPTHTNTTSNRPSHGLYYQWGRPTPMRTYGTYTGGDLVDRNTSENINLTTALTSHKYIQGTAERIDWYEERDDMWNSRWADQSVDKDKAKSPFDPCPEGWRIPSGKPSSPWEGIKHWEAAAFWQTKSGKFLDYTDNTITADDPAKRVIESWFPAAGGRQTDGRLYRLGEYGYYHLASTINTTSHHMGFSSAATSSLAIGGRSNGVSVRCTQE